jgi:DNA mismatch repair protein MutS
MINITGGRHPVVENVLGAGSYVSNDVELDNDDTRVIVLTGPNMAGKSTFIRQVAIITLMAQIGSFVPATAARIGLVDRIFTRVGLQDDLTTGKSTFMVEMVETASILNQATNRSLLILDEIGRGTSTYDGLSIARSVIEYVHSNPRLKCKTMFATHYHELTTLQETLPGVRNFNVAVVEQGSKIIFLHKIISGGADRSYGVHVAQLAGMPLAVVKRAWEILSELETAKEPTKVHMDGHGKEIQMNLFSGVSDVLSAELRKIDIENLTPIEAINRLYDLRRKAEDMGNEL